MIERKPFIIKVEDDIYEARPDNTALQTYAGHLAAYNHVLIQGEEVGGEYESIAIFKTCDDYDIVRRQVQRRHFPQILNMPAVSDEIVEMYASQYENDLESWMK